MENRWSERNKKIKVEKLIESGESEKINGLMKFEIQTFKKR